MDQTRTHSEHWFPPVDLSNISGMATQPSANFPDLTELVTLWHFILLTPAPTLETSRFLGFWTLPPPSSPPASVSVPPPPARAPLTLFHSRHSPSWTLCAMPSPSLYSQAQPLTAPKQQSLGNSYANDPSM